MNPTVRTIGTASAIATVERAHSAAVVRGSSGVPILVDVGDGTARALLAADEPIADVAGVLISHFHPDHAGGLPGLVQQLRLAGLDSPRPLLLPAIALERLPTLLKGFGITDEKFRAVFRPMAFPKDGTAVQLSADLAVEAQRNTHQQPTSTLGESHSFIFRCRDHTLYVSADVGSIADVRAHAQRCKTAVVETTHVDPDEVIAAASSLGIETLILTHVPPEWEERALRNSERDGTNVHWATDGDTYTW